MMALVDPAEVRARVLAEALPCPLCGELVHPDNLARHNALYHQRSGALITRADIDALAATDQDFLRITEQIHETALALLKDEPDVETLLEAKNKVQALGDYITRKVRARDAKLEAQNNIAEVRIRYERELGRLIQKMQADGELAPKNGNANHLPNTMLDRLNEHLTLNDIGITHIQSSRGQDMAALPDDKFEEQIASAKENGWELTSAAIQKHGRAHRLMVLRETKYADVELSGDLYQLYVGDLVDVCQQYIADESVDWIITDPPYGGDHLHLYAKLSTVAARVLKPGGALLCMTGQTHLPAVIGDLARDLTYYWTLSYLTPGPSPRLWQRNVITKWKPVLWFVKGDYNGNVVSDVAHSNAREKREHEWQQSESGMEELIERFTYPGQLILDPLCGAGTTGVVAVRRRRRFVGIDVDSAAIAIASERLASCSSS